MLHFNELPFRALFKFYDGDTSGPKSTSGPIGQEIISIRSQKESPISTAPFVDFDPVEGPELVIDDELLVNEDQKYFYQICLLTKNGLNYLVILGDGFVLKLPGNISNARWLTTASSILYVYCKTENPSRDLCRLVKYILNVYAPIFFRVKKEYLIQNGALHYFSALFLARKCLTKTEFTHVKTTFLNNSYMATSEYILLAGIFDTNLNIRKKSSELIIKARKMHKRGVRKYELPKTCLKLDKASNYFELLDFTKLQSKYFTPPPILQEFSDEEIIQAGKNELQLDIPKIPCHSQNCERAVASTTLASQHAIGVKKRHEFLLNLQRSREQIKGNAGKRNYLDL